MNTQQSREQLKNHIPLVAVNSKRILAAGYEASTLAVQFPGNASKGETEGPIYHYFNVPQEAYDAFLAAESKGSYFEGHVRHAYDYQRIEPSTGERKTVERKDDTQKAAA